MQLDDFSYNLTLKEKIELIRKNPVAYYEKNVHNIDFDKFESIEDIICLLFSGSSSMDSGMFETLSTQLMDYSGFSDNIEYQFYYFSNRGSYFRYVNERKYALDCFEKASKISLLLDDPDRIVRSYIYLSSIYAEAEDFEMAMHYSDLAMQFVNTVADDRVKADLFNNFGVSLYYLKDYKRSRDIVFKAYLCFQQVPNYESYLNYVILLINLGDLESINENKEKAAKYYREGLSLAEKLDHFRYLVRNLESAAEFLIDQGEYEEALRFRGLYIKELERANLERSAIEMAYDRQRHKEDHTTLKTLKKENDYLVIHLTNLYKKMSIGEEDFEEKKVLLTQIKTAVNKGEFKPYLQPQYSLGDHRIIGAELLMRWIKPDGTMVMPSTFIGLIEESDVLHYIWVDILHQSMVILKEILEEYDDSFRLSINVSPYQLSHNDVFASISKEQLLLGIPSKNIEVEITERTFLTSNPRVERELQSLVDGGIMISLDDFGTGYSSLSCLNTIPLSSVKMDISLLENSPGNEKSDTLYKSIYQLLRNMGFHVVAEGVENDNQVRFLSSIGCENVQGFYFSEAMDSDQFIDFVDKNKK